MAGSTSSGVSVALRVHEKLRRPFVVQAQALGLEVRSRLPSLEPKFFCPLADATVSFALRSNSSSGTLTRRRRSARRRRSYARSRSTCTLTTPSATRSSTSTTMRTRSTLRSASSASGWTRQPRTPSWTERARTRGRTGDDDQVARGRSSNASNDVHIALREREREQEAQTANKA